MSRRVFYSLSKDNIILCSLEKALLLIIHMLPKELEASLYGVCITLNFSTLCTKFSYSFVTSRSSKVNSLTYSAPGAAKHSTACLKYSKNWVHGFKITVIQVCF